MDRLMDGQTDRQTVRQTDRSYGVYIKQEDTQQQRAKTDRQTYLLCHKTDLSGTLSVPATPLTVVALVCIQMPVLACIRLRGMALVLKGRSVPLATGRAT